MNRPHRPTDDDLWRVVVLLSSVVVVTLGLFFADAHGLIP